MALAGTVEQDIEDADRRTELVSPVQWHKSQAFVRCRLREEL